ncbi:MAG: PH domain-containing protein [Rhizobiales bacterium]|nr:PH domain-containing protein [Hyphomicrobiales bacterium]
MSSEFDFNPRRGIAPDLPEGERVLWQGAPNWFGLATEVFHVRVVALYFVALAVWRLASGAMAGEGLAESAAGVALIAGLGSLAVGLLLAIAGGYARTTYYSITTHRVVIRSGIALQVAFNLPLSRVTGVALSVKSGDSGDIALTLDGSAHIAYAHLWPNARPWKLSRPEPTLRCLVDGKSVADVLVGALAAHRPITMNAVANTTPARLEAQGDRTRPAPARKSSRTAGIGAEAGASRMSA